MHPLVELARTSVETYVREGKILDPPSPLSPEMSERAGVFVCLKKHGQLKGCIGTFQPTCDTIGAEVIRNAISAATNDNRFSPVKEEELDEIAYSVDILSSPEKVENTTELDPKKYGVIVKADFRQGLLLPDLEGVDTVEDQLRIARLKAGILPNEDTDIYRFEVKRYK
jgi:hypothetical protein